MRVAKLSKDAHICALYYSSRCSLKVEQPDTPTCSCPNHLLDAHLLFICWLSLFLLTDLRYCTRQQEHWLQIAKNIILETMCPHMLDKLSFVFVQNVDGEGAKDMGNSLFNFCFVLLLSLLSLLLVVLRLLLCRCSCFVV